jgi:hypothetical protein
MWTTPFAEPQGVPPDLFAKKKPRSNRYALRRGLFNRGSQIYRSTAQWADNAYLGVSPAGAGVAVPSAGLVSPVPAGGGLPPPVLDGVAGFVSLLQPVTAKAVTNSRIANTFFIALVS